MTMKKLNNNIKGWYFSDEEIDLAISQKLLINPSIDLTNACNLNCTYCYIEDDNVCSKKKRPNELLLEERIKLIDDLVQAGAKTINIVGAGEPSLDFHFEEILKYISNKNLDIVLFTNGIEIVRSHSLLDFLWDNNVSVVLKFNSLSETIQDTIVGKKGYTNVRDNALELLIKKGFNSCFPTRLGLDIIAFTGILDELAQIHLKCRELNIFPIMSNFIPAGRTKNGEVNSSVLTKNDSTDIDTFKLLQPLSSSQKAVLMREILKIDSSFDITQYSRCAYYGGAKCTQILGLYIDITGNIYPCVAKKMVKNKVLQNGLLGNFRNGDLPSKIWNSHSYLESIRNQYTGECLYKIL